MFSSLRAYAKGYLQTTKGYLKPATTLCFMGPQLCFSRCPTNARSIDNCRTALRNPVTKLTMLFTKRNMHEYILLGSITSPYRIYQVLLQLLNDNIKNCKGFPLYMCYECFCQLSFVLNPWCNPLSVEIWFDLINNPHTGSLSINT